MRNKDLIQRIALKDEGERAVQLNRADWLEAALKVFMTEGIEAVRITRVADALNVTRGGFYWHFKDRQDLHDALQSYWRETNVESVLHAVDSSNNLLDGILALYDAWLDPAKFEPGLDLAMRDWARRSASARTAVKQADEACVKKIAAFFKKHGFNSTESRARARTMYDCQIGYYMVNGLDEPIKERLRYLEPLIYILTGQALASDQARRFRDAHAQPAVS